MDYNLNNLNRILTSPELLEMAKGIMTEYRNIIGDMMTSTISSDIRELHGTYENMNMKELADLAEQETPKRMVKYGAIFFESEMARLLDAYNDNIYDSIEFNIRCEILSSLVDSMKSFEFDEIIHS